MNGPLTPDEKDRIFNTLDAQTEILEKLQKGMEKLDRGMYGDEPNGVKGALRDIESIKDWISKSKIKISFIAGLGTAVGFLLSKCWEWLVNHK